MKFSPRLLCLLALVTVSSALHAANPCLSGGAPQPREGAGKDGTGTGGTGYTARLNNSTDGSGAGGTGHAPGKGDGSGAGGTGAPQMAANDGSGTGGTGHETEVEGVITGFASICVNGLELHYQADTPIAVNGKAASPKDLAVGQVVRAQAKGKDDQFAIARLQIRYVMVAPLQDISASHAQVMGKNVRLENGAQLPGALEPGQKVAVSGFVGPGGAVFATRLDAVSPDTPDSINGEVSRDEKGRRTIGGVPVDGVAAELRAGESARAEGRFENGRLLAERVEHDEPAGRAERFIIQGAVKETGKDSLDVGGKRLVLGPASADKHEPLPRAGSWVRVEGVRRGKDLQIEKVEVQGRILPASRDLQEKSRKESALPARELRQTTDQSRERSEHIEREDHSEEAERPESPEKPEETEAPEHPERVESPEKPEEIEAPERQERFEAPEKPESEAIERPERVEAPEKPEKYEAPERPERPESPEHDD